MQDVQWHPTDFLTILVRDEDIEVTPLELGPLPEQALCNLLGDIQGVNVIRQLGTSFVYNGF
ncbi:MAG: hypothetical protein AB1745_29780 [Pseudomonadota bacterium]|jgi:hypothetical protein